MPPCRVHEDGGKEKLYAASLSGGKDSTAMVLRLVEEGWPLDFVMFCDTGLEFPQMYEHVEKLEKALPVPVVRLKEEKALSITCFVIRRSGRIRIPPMRAGRA